MLGLEARHVQTDVLRRERRRTLDPVAQEPAGKRRERHERDPRLASRFEHAEFRVAAPQRVLVLHCGDGGLGLRLAQPRHRHLGEADGADLAGRDQLGEGADALGDRHLLVPAMQVVEVDALDAEPRERGVELRPQRLGTAVDRFHAVDQRHTAFAREHEFIATAAPLAQGAPDELFIPAAAVERGRIEHADALIKSRVQKRQTGLGRRRHAVGVTQGHAAETDPGQLHRDSCSSSAPSTR